MVEFLVLINQIICKFNSSASGILEDVFPTIASRLSVILSQDAFLTGPAGNTEVKLITSRNNSFIYIHFL
jgi:exportin-T